MNWSLHPERFFSSEKTQRAFAVEIFKRIENLPIISPHGHIDPNLFADENLTFTNPVDLLIKPDHYVFRLLYSQGISLESIGIPNKHNTFKENDPRRIWQIFANNFHIFYGTPTGAWLEYVLNIVFSITTKLSSTSAQYIYDEISEALKSSEFRPRNLFERFNIEVLCTTDSALDPLSHHITIRNSGWKGRILPTFRPDILFNLSDPNWRENINSLEIISEIELSSFNNFILSLENRRVFFKKNGATSTDIGVFHPYAEHQSNAKVEGIFQRALKGENSSTDNKIFSSHMLYEMARMSADDGLVMQIHPGSWRNYNSQIFSTFGPDKGFDIPVMVNYTNNLHSLLDKFGNHPNFSCILFTLDESTYSRELAPLAGAYPSIKLGPPWWFHDSPNGMTRYFNQVMETAGIWNTTGFNDDTRSFPSIPARHDLWRRLSSNWLGGLVSQHRIGLDDAHMMAKAMAVDLARKAYKFEVVT